jgi:hypothetical protein
MHLVCQRDKHSTLRITNKEPDNGLSTKAHLHKFLHLAYKLFFVHMHELILSEFDEQETDVYGSFYSCRQCWASKSRGL